MEPVHCFITFLHLGPVYISKNNSPATPGADRRRKFQPLFIWDFYLTCQPPGWEARWSNVSHPWNQNELTNRNQGRKPIHLIIVFRLYGKITIPVVLRLSYKREMKKQWDSIGRRNLTCQPRVWQVRCSSPYKQVFNERPNKLWTPCTQIYIKANFYIKTHSFLSW